jgi:hypothetical protein
MLKKLKYPPYWIVTILKIVRIRNICIYLRLVLTR